jgi:queuine tRNA-ribosyltransferase
MPVATQGTVRAITSRQLAELGAEIVLANAYHLYLRPGLEVIGAAGSLHEFMAWDKPLLTDSGGYQVFSLSGLREVGEEGVTFRSPIDGSEHFFSPEAAVEIQHALGVEIVMSFDEMSPFSATPGEAEAATLRSDRWSERGKRRHDALGGRALFGIVQGGFSPELREASARRLIELGFDGYATGGLSVGEPKELTFSIAAHCAKLLPENAPRYLMGVGLPEDIVAAVQAGYDMFDCVLPTRMGRHGTALTRAGRINLRNQRYQKDFRSLDEQCACDTCRNYSRAYLRHLYQARELLALILICYHNLYYYLDLMGELREALGAGRLEDYCREFEARRKSGEDESNGKSP